MNQCRGSELCRSNRSSPRIPSRHTSPACPAWLRRVLNDYRWFRGSHITLVVVYYVCLILHPLPGNPAIAHKGKVYVSRRWQLGAGSPGAVTNQPCMRCAGGLLRQICRLCTFLTSSYLGNHPPTSFPCPLQLYVCLPLTIYVANVLWNRWRRRGALARVVKAEVNGA